jgi:hypothetical protein
MGLFQHFHPMREDVEFRQHVQGGDTGAGIAGKRQGRCQRRLGGVGTVGGDQDVLVHGMLLWKGARGAGRNHAVDFTLVTVASVGAARAHSHDASQISLDLAGAALVPWSWLM